MKCVNCKYYFQRKRNKYPQCKHHCLGERYLHIRDEFYCADFKDKEFEREDKKNEED